MKITRTCDACGIALKGSIRVGGASLCWKCFPAVREEVDKAIAEGKKPSAIGIAREMFREQYSSGTFTMRDVPEKLWQKARVFATKNKISLRDLVLEAVRQYIGE